MYSLTSKGISEESIKNPSTSENSFAPKSVDYSISKMVIYGNLMAIY